MKRNVVANDAKAGAFPETKGFLQQTTLPFAFAVSTPFVVAVAQFSRR